MRVIFEEIDVLKEKIDCKKEGASKPPFITLSHHFSFHDLIYHFDFYLLIKRFIQLGLLSIKVRLLIFFAINDMKIITDKKCFSFIQIRRFIQLDPLPVKTPFMVYMVT